MGTLKLCSLFHNAVQIFAAEDPDTEVKSDTRSSWKSCYKEIYMEKGNKVVQLTMDSFLIARS